MAKNNYKYLFFSVALAMMFMCAGPAGALAFTVDGVLKNAGGCFYPKVYLEVITDLDGFSSSSSQHLIASAPVDKDGHFTLTGNDLPEEKRYYRLYLTQNAAISSAIHTGSTRNYILLVLSNQSAVTVSCDNFCKPYFTYNVIDSSRDNTAMLHVQNLILEAEMAMAEASAASKKEFIKNTLDKLLRQFADTTYSAMAGLWALSEMGIDSSYAHDPEFTERFAKRFNASGNKFYADRLEAQLKMTRYKNESHEAGAMHTGILVLVFLLLASVGLNVFLLVKRTAVPQQSVTAADDTMQLVAEPDDETGYAQIIESLTIKEREILQMIHEGLSNKEIAVKLNIETSTVKTHVSRIYQKAGISSRREVAAIARYMQGLQG